MLKALAEGVEWSKSLDKTLKRVVMGEIATWENAITTKLKVATEYTDKNGQPLVYFTGTSLLLERVMWPLQKHASYKKRYFIIIYLYVSLFYLYKCIFYLTILIIFAFYFFLTTLIIFIIFVILLSHLFYLFA